MPTEFRLREAERVREQLTVQQERHIRGLYRQALLQTRKWSASLEGKDNISSILRTQYLMQMENDLKAEMRKVGVNTERTILSNMLSTATAVSKDSNKLLFRLGINVSGAYSKVPSEVVSAISTGTVYNSDWSLSKAIWGHTKKSQQDIHDIIAIGIAQNKSSYDIAKDLEKYVNPSAAKPWDWGKIYPGTSRKVDYNAQRLARTMVSHAYEQSFVATTKDNPFFLGYRWLTSGNHNVCPICIGYAEDVHDKDLPAGVFPKDDLPIDHPNGKCTFAVYMEDSPDDVADKLAAWVNGESNSDLDDFAGSLGYSVREMKEHVKTD